MIKLTYFLSIFIVSSLTSCEKKTATPSSPTNTKPPVTKDTLSGKIYTIVGNGTHGYSGDGGVATAAELYNPVGVAVDGSGNIYIADNQNNRIRKVNSSGVISTIAGNGTGGYSGDGGPATSAQIYYPEGIALDGSGNIYFADYNNMRIRKINTSGIISTIVGNGFGAHGTGGFSGDGGPATAAELALPYGITFDGSGNLYIADDGNQRIRMVNTSGIISTIAGNGTALYSGDGGPATTAEIAFPQGVAVDALGNIYIADYGNNRIRMINTAGIITTIAGNGYGASFASGGYSGDGGPATQAELYNPTDVIVDGSGNLYISDADNYCIRLVTANGIISTFAGTGTLGGFFGDGGMANTAKIGFCQGIGQDGSGNIYIADLFNNRIRVVYK